MLINDNEGMWEEMIISNDNDNINDNQYINNIIYRKWNNQANINDNENINNAL